MPSVKGCRPVTSRHLPSRDVTPELSHRNPERADNGGQMIMARRRAVFLPLPLRYSGSADVDMAREIGNAHPEVLAPGPDTSVEIHQVRLSTT